ncbi:hypothetical protein [Alcanivorax sp. 1008]|uniref:hypothetical protein n=1 Tax=Alcanivorax sp. 1008 TaxID=2816853 RepID=UPI001D6561B5|nr:hypothetical protein [Alcanivorax sp. 1008]MCC1496888.1 hypothetical protein [Alcanivorax sp. 1008]
MDEAYSAYSEALYAYGKDSAEIKELKSLSQSRQHPALASRVRASLGHLIASKAASKPAANIAMNAVDEICLQIEANVTDLYMPGRFRASINHISFKIDDETGCPSSSVAFLSACAKQGLIEKGVKVSWQDPDGDQYVCIISSKGEAHYYDGDALATLDMNAMAEIGISNTEDDKEKFVRAMLEDAAGIKPEDVLYMLAREASPYVLSNIKKKVALLAARQQHDEPNPLADIDDARRSAP